LHSGVRAVDTMTASGMPSTLAAFAHFGIHSGHERRDRRSVHRPARASGAAAAHRRKVR
jgi:hypothetical protein